MEKGKSALIKEMFEMREVVTEETRNFEREGKGGRGGGRVSKLVRRSLSSLVGLD